MKKLYAIGTGPGDKEQLTLKAVKSMQDSSVIFAPNNKGKNMALDTASDFIKEKKIILLDFPMGRVNREHYVKAAKVIQENIPENGKGAFLTIGDPMIYSTFIYIMDELDEEKIQTEIINGIPSFLAASAAMKTPLTLKGDSFLLCDELDDKKAKNYDSLAILKTLRIENKEDILRMLEENNFKYKYIKKVSFKEQEIMENKEDILKDSNYLSLILARKEED